MRMSLQREIEGLFQEGDGCHDHKVHEDLSYSLFIALDLFLSQDVHCLYQRDDILEAKDKSRNPKGYDG